MQSLEEMRKELDVIDDQITTRIISQNIHPIRPE